MSSFRNFMLYFILHGKTTLNHMVELCLYRISRKSHHSLDDIVLYLQKIKVYIFKNKYYINDYFSKTTRK